MLEMIEAVLQENADKFKKLLSSTKSSELSAPDKYGLSVIKAAACRPNSKIIGILISHIEKIKDFPPLIKHADIVLLFNLHIHTAANFGISREKFIDKIIAPFYDSGAVKYLKKELEISSETCL